MIVPFHIDGHGIGPGEPCFIIAEAGVNHNGSLEMAYQLIEAAAAARADAVKFQTFVAEAVISPDAPKAEYQKVTTDARQSQLEMVKTFELPPSAFALLAAHCRKHGIMFLSTPFDHASVDLLAGLNVAAFKLPSGEVTNTPLLRHVAAQGRPVILSSGMSGLGEVEAALATLRAHGARQLAVLHCTSAYPAPPASVNLRAMDTLAAAFQIPTGYSDHTEGIAISVAAAARGAMIVEKHFTLDKTLPGPDHKASLDPAELAAMVAAIRAVEAALGDGIKQADPAELNTRDVARRSLFAARDIKAGAAILDADLIALRPVGGISPLRIDDVVGRNTRRAIAKGARLDWQDLT